MDSPPPAAARPWAADALASLVVFMVALPLCVAIAEACGYPPEAGIITGVVGGILVGALAGSPLQVSGPAAGLIVVVLDQVHEHGKEGMALVLALGGLMQIGFGLLRLGPYFRAVAPAVVLGMLAGIGAIILGKQFHVLFDRKAPDSVIEAFRTAPNVLMEAVNAPFPNGPAAAGIVGALTVLIMAGWKSVVPKKFTIIPAAVVAVVAASLLAGVAGWEVKKVHIDGLLDDLQNIPSPPFGRLLTPGLWTAALTLALIASAETLLCATAVDAKHNGPRTNFNKELFAQGLGNIICGFLGALPMTGVIVRSAANVDAGAKTRRSAILHGIWLLLFVTFLDDVLARVPVSALAGVLVFTGWKLLELPAVWKLWNDKVSRQEAVFYLVTAAGIVLTDLLTGVLIGLGVSAARLLWMLGNLEIKRVDDPDGKAFQLHLLGAATFLRLPDLAAELERVPPGRNLHVHVEQVTFVDHAVLNLLHTFETRYESAGGQFTVDWERVDASFRSTKPTPTSATQYGEFALPPAPVGR